MLVFAFPPPPQKHNGICRNKKGMQSLGILRLHYFFFLLEFHPETENLSPPLTFLHKVNAMKMDNMRRDEILCIYALLLLLESEEL